MIKFKKIETLGEVLQAEPKILPCLKEVNTIWYMSHKGKTSVMKWIERSEKSGKNGRIGLKLAVKLKQIVRHNMWFEDNYHEGLIETGKNRYSKREIKVMWCWILTLQKKRKEKEDKKKEYSKKEEKKVAPPASAQGS